MLDFVLENILVLGLVIFICLNLLCFYIGPDIPKRDNKYNLGFTLSGFGSDLRTRKIFSINLLITGFAIFYYQYNILQTHRLSFNSIFYYLDFALILIALFSLIGVVMFPYVEFNLIHNSFFFLFMVTSIIFMLLTSIVLHDNLSLMIGISSFSLPLILFFITKKFTIPQLDFMLLFIIGLISLGYF